MELFLGDEYRVTQRAAWLVSHCVDAHPWLIRKPACRRGRHLKSLPTGQAGMIENLQKNVHVAVKRNTVRILQFMEIPEDMMGITAEICFKFLNSGKETIAVKANAMTVLYTIVKKYPELKEELEISIQEQMPFGPAGFKSKGRKILQALSKI